MQEKSARDILKERDGLNDKQADAAIRETRDLMMLSDPYQALDILCDELGLEPEYLEQVLCM